MIKNIDLNAKFNRAIFLVHLENRIFFGLAIKRPEHVKDRWCFYLGITEEEYSILVERFVDDPLISFIGLPSASINVPELIADRWFTPSPGRFVGCHFDKDPTGAGWSSVSLISTLDFFVDQILRKLKNGSQAAPQLARV